VASGEPGRPAHGLAGVPDAGAFLARLVRLDDGALVRLRSSGSRIALWARLPWGVLVTREVAGVGPADATVSAAAGIGSADATVSAAAAGVGFADATVSAAELLAELAGGGTGLPTRRDDQWRWPLPPPVSRAVESVASAELSRLAAAAAGTLREAASAGVGGRAVGQRALREALLDHVALVVTPPEGRPVEVSQRLVQAVFRMGFLGPSGVDESSSRVCVAPQWVGISAPFGVAWRQSVNTLAVSPMFTHPNG
jgi:hypothetical protein